MQSNAHKEEAGLIKNGIQMMRPFSSVLRSAEEFIATLDTCDASNIGTCNQGGISYKN